ncbi:MAG: hypothetical protein V1746_02720 [bacterium]
MATYQEMLKDSRWLLKRGHILESRHRKCQKCNKSESEVPLTIHHGYYQPKTEPWNYEDDTLWAFCWPCHVQAQQILVSVHRTLARVFPFDLEVIGRKMADSAFEWIHGISAQELEEILAEEQSAFRSQFSDYTLSIVSCSDLGPSCATEMEASAQNAFPGITVDIIHNLESPDCVASTVGPDHKICQTIDYWCQKWIT